MDSPMNRYEQQLYSVFKTFDIDNEEALKRSAVLQLCDSLQLEDRGAALVDTLFDRQSDRITFSQFRNGLLSVLDKDPIRRQENCSSKESVVPKTPSPAQSDDDSREVGAKFAFGSERYGRRSRPHRVTAEDTPRPRVASESRLDSVRARRRMRCKRSSSAMESREDDVTGLELDHEQRVDRDRALALCRGLDMHGVDRFLVDRVFAASDENEVTVGEFFDRLNASLTTSIETSLDGGIVEGDSKSDSDIVSSDTVVETWKRAGVRKPMGLLLELGFGEAALRLQSLEHVLDDELRANSSQTDSRLPLAAYSLSRIRLESVGRLLEVARGERDKLREDLGEANRRARLLAQDVDENHDRIEAELKSRLRQMEARHAEAVRVAAAEAGVERERAAVARVALEEEAARRADTEIRLRDEITSLQERIEEYQERAAAAEARCEHAEREQSRLQEELRRAEERDAERASREEIARDELETRLRESREERARLRDRCDELGAALEVAGATRLAREGAARCWRDEVDAQAPDSLPDVCDLSLQSFDKKDAQEIIEKLMTFLTNIREISVGDGNSCASCDHIAKTAATFREALRSSRYEGADTIGHNHVTERDDEGAQTDLESVQEVEALKKTLADLEHDHRVEKDSLTNVVKELETSLEQMKTEYEKCEEYWSDKLEEEREAFAEEQRAGDERLADLAARIADYERQFAPAPLPTIDERDQLELQVNQLQDEFDTYRRTHEAELAAKSEELRRLHRRLEAAEGASCVCGGAAAARWRAAVWREAGALRARAGRAERAAHRLHARLAAADLLVKDLYLENCRLAHGPRLP
ncbi:blastoderm-specific protein 25D [Danaus plexippus]|uniref:blastoderm-specific protein 25D n=1 Tax=Danaus plexippus TaxID=13037 RepID=UPI002AAFFF50|nr:blastoderm-specific protein 25D [Danaus plexippus]